MAGCQKKAFAHQSWLTAINTTKQNKKAVLSQGYRATSQLSFLV